MDLARPGQLAARDALETLEALDDGHEQITGRSFQ